jgi:hypothetical protein
MEQIATALFDEASRLFPVELRELRRGGTFAPDMMLSDGVIVPYETEANRQLLRERVRNALDVLTRRERTVIELRFGIKDGRPRTLDIIGNELGVTRERAHQIEAQALEKLRRAESMRCLMFVDDVEEEKDRARRKAQYDQSAEAWAQRSLAVEEQKRIDLYYERKRAERDAHSN